MKNGRETNRGRQWLRLALLSYLTVLGMALQTQAQTIGGSPLSLFFASFSGFSVSLLLLLAGLFFYYREALRAIGAARWTGRDKACVMIPAGLFAAFMVLGRAFAEKGNWEPVLGGSVQLVRSAVVWNGYFIAFSISIALLFTWLPTARIWQGNEENTQGGGLWGRYQRSLCVHPFRTAFLTLLVCYLPLAVLSYPGVIMGDDADMIAQGFNLPCGTSDAINLIDEKVFLNGHHPIAYTLLLHGCLVTGKAIFGAYNCGVFLLVLLQALAQFSVMAAVVAELMRRKLRPGIAAGLLAFFIAAPRTQNYAFLVSKDVMNAAALLLFLLFLFRVLAADGKDGRAMLGCALSAFTVCLFRNEGKYIILASFVIMLLLLRQKRRQIVLPGFAALLAAGLFFYALMPALHITKGSAREMLSVPFQQTARYVRDHGDDVTAEERAAIDAVLDYDGLAERYEPELSDRVKETYNKAATKQELADYFKVWLRMGLRHPGSYVQATMHNYYRYFYPDAGLADFYSFEWSEHCMGVIDNLLGLEGITLGLHYPQALSRWRTGYETLREGLSGLPVLSLLRCSAAYVWGLLLLAFYWVKRRGRLAFSMLLPLLFILGACLLGPANGNYFRYLYGISVTLPPVFFFGAYLERQRHESDTK